jgi:hypothetical protein
MSNQIKKSNTMKTNQIFGLVIAAIIFFSNTEINAQKKSNSLHRKAQVSFFYPVGSNGQSTAYSSNFSFNYLFGMNGGVNGFEMGGVANHNKGNVLGAQIAGISNSTYGNVSSVQLAGIANVTKGSTKGVQISGIANVNNGSTKGFQLSTVNVANGETKGFQLGVVNYARKMKGINLGIINILGDAEGAIPIGLINIVKGGYYEVEATGGDALNANINFKMGVERFYTIFKTGHSTFKDKSVYSYGIGFGTLIPFSEKHKMSIDLSTNAIGYDGEWNAWDEEKNILNKLDITYRRQLTSKLSLIAGPSLNYYISEVKLGESFGTLKTKGNLSTSENDTRKKSTWIGFNAGLAFRL